MIGTRNTDGSYALIYFPTGKTVDVDFSKLKNQTLEANWYDPRTGVSFPYSGSALIKGEIKISTPSRGKSQDWVLIME